LHAFLLKNLITRLFYPYRQGAPIMTISTEKANHPQHQNRLRNGEMVSQFRKRVTRKIKQRTLGRIPPK